MYLPWVLIGWLDRPCPLRLASMMTLALVFRHSLAISELSSVTVSKLLKLCYENKFDLNEDNWKMELIFKWMASHEDSFWHRGERQLALTLAHNPNHKIAVFKKTATTTTRTITTSTTVISRTTTTTANYMWNYTISTMSKAAITTTTSTPVTTRLTNHSNDGKLVCLTTLLY